MTEKLGRIAVLGCGNMGAALVRGLRARDLLPGKDLVLTDVDREKLKALAAETGAKTAPGSREAAASADLVLIAVKPKDMKALLADIAPAFKAGGPRLLLSVAAGIPLSLYEGSLPAGTGVIRVMPNMPALVGCGAAALARGRAATDKDMDLARRILESVGTAVEVPEALMDAVTALSGSGPGFLMRVAEGLIRGGIEQGLPPDRARLLAAQTLKGSGELLLKVSDSPEELARKVASPGGTTEAGLKALGEPFVATVAEAVRLAALRSREMGKNS